MHAGVAVQAFQLDRMAPKLLPSGAVLDDITQLLLFLKLILKFDPWLGLNHLGQHIGIAIADPHYPRHVANHTFSAQSTIGDNMRNGTLSVFLSNILDHLRAATLTKININIRRTDPLWVEESLEEQPKSHRANIGNSHRISDQRASRRSTSWAHRNILIATPLNKVSCDQEIGGKAKIVDGLDFIIKPLIENLHHCIGRDILLLGKLC